MRITIIGASLVSLALTGCGLVDALADPAVRADLEIHNRTLDPLVYENADGQAVEVPSCASMLAEDFGINTVSVRAPGGYVRSFGANAPEFSGRRMHVVEVASAAESGIPQLGPAPAELPPCEGHAEAQPGT